MRIEEIHIDGFGLWNNRTWAPLAPALNVFSGPNEAGKSTLMAFIRSILFGFERRDSPRRYEPLNGGLHGGWLTLTANGRPIRVERRAGRHVRGTVNVCGEDVAGNEEGLERLLGGTTRTLYHNVFAFGLQELEQFHTLQENEVATHISGAGLGIGAARWTRIQQDLEDRQNALYLPRGQNSAINVALKDLEAVREDLDRTEPHPHEYVAANEARVRLDAEIRALEESAARAAALVRKLDRLRKARLQWERRKAIEVRLRETAPVDQFPAGGVERLNPMLHQLRRLQDEMSQKEGENEKRRIRRQELVSAFKPHELDRRARALELLRVLVPRTEAARSAHTAALERRAALLREKQALESALEASRPPAASAAAIFLALLWTGTLAVFIWGDLYAAISLVLASSGVILWYRHRRSRAANLEQQNMKCFGRLAACAQDIDKSESDIRQLEAEIKELAGKADVSPQDLEAEASEVEKLSKITEELRLLDEACARTSVELERISAQIAETDQGIRSLLKEGGASSENEFLERAEIHQQRRKLRDELQRIPAEIVELGPLLEAREDDGYEAAAREATELEQRLSEARRESGRLEERVAAMERSEERSRALGRQESILGRIDVAAERWAVLTLARSLFEETRKVYENERQPEVLRQASAFFDLMTGGTYRRVIAPLDSAELQVERNDGARLSPEMLSRGTAEQLYLAMRLALVREYARHVEPLPVVFDDIFVNFDPERTRTCLEAVRELSQTHQTLVFTCHPHLLATIQEIVPGVRVFQLQ